MTIEWTMSFTGIRDIGFEIKFTCYFFILWVLEMKSIDHECKVIFECWLHPCSHKLYLVVGKIATCILSCLQWKHIKEIWIVQVSFTTISFCLYRWVILFPSLSPYYPVSSGLLIPGSILWTYFFYAIQSLSYKCMQNHLKSNIFTKKGMIIFTIIL